MRLDYKRTFLIGFGFFGTSVMWKLYNGHVPIFTNANIGAFTGLYYLASQLAAIAGPTLNGVLIERTGNYGLTLLAPVFLFTLAAITMQGVTRGEARQVA